MPIGIDMKPSELIKYIENMTIDTYNEKYISAFEEAMYFDITELDDLKKIFNCSIRVRTPMGGHVDVTIMSNKTGKELKKKISKKCNIPVKTFKLYNICTGTPDVGDLMFTDGRIGKLLNDNETVFAQHIKPVSFFELNISNK
jgi:hypothetical protein